MDIQMPGMDGIEATRRIKRETPSTTIVMLTVRDDEEKLFDAIRNGAQGYLLKQMQSKELVEMIRRAMAGEVAIPPRLAGQMLEEFRRLSHLAPQETEDAAALSARELDVLNQVALGKTDKEIAQILSLSIHTVKTHLRSILTKLQVSGRKSAVRVAKGKGILDGS
jgi:DNA-binding NarL/FixJ family response regulator